jgi:hypothetical protein
MKGRGYYTPALLHVSALEPPSRGAFRKRPCLAGVGAKLSILFGTEPVPPSRATEGIGRADLRDARVAIGLQGVACHARIVRAQSRITAAALTADALAAQTLVVVFALCACRLIRLGRRNARDGGQRSPYEGCSHQPERLTARACRWPVL